MQGAFAEEISNNYTSCNDSNNYNLSLYLYKSASLVFKNIGIAATDIISKNWSHGNLHVFYFLFCQ